MKLRASVSLALLAISLAACATGNTSPSLTIGNDDATTIVDPGSGRLDARYASTNVSLADMINRQIGGGLDANDRRLIDIAFDQALLTAPAEGPTLWSNPANNHAGEVDLMRWLVDQRQRQTCGIVNHQTRLGVGAPLTGSLTICRASLAADWQVDTASFDPQPSTTVTTPRPAPAPTAPVASPTTPAPAQAPAQAKTVQEAVPTATQPDRTITRTSDDIVPAPGTGQQNLGDLLQDQAPHTEVQ